MTDTYAINLTFVRHLLEKIDKAHELDEDAAKFAYIASSFNFNPKDPLFQVLVLQFAESARQERIANKITEMAQQLAQTSSRMEKAVADNGKIQPLALARRFKVALASGAALCVAVGLTAGLLFSRGGPHEQAPRRHGLDAVVRALASPAAPNIINLIEGGDLDLLARCDAPGWVRREKRCLPFPADINDRVNSRTWGWRLEP